MAVELAPNEGKQNVGQNGIGGRTVYCGAIFGQTVAANTITALSTLATLPEDTAIARVAVVLPGMDAFGILPFPGVTLTAGVGGKTNVQAWFWASASSGGVAIFVWDLSTTRDMSVVGTTIIIPALDYFFKNPAE